MNKSFQRRGSKSNTHVGNEFENAAKHFFRKKGIVLEQNVPVDIGINGRKHNPTSFQMILGV